MDKTLLAICPSRGRPDLVVEMLKSFDVTRSPRTDIVIYLADDDPTLNDYYNNIESFITKVPRYPKYLKILTDKRRHIAEVFNHIALSYREYDYYAPHNDDHFFVTPQWDEKLISIVESHGGWGIAGADDKLTDWVTCQHPSGCVISGNIVRTLGYMVPPGIRHIGIDTFLARIAQGIDRLYLTRDVVIEHRHWLNGHRKIDDNYKWVYGEEEQKHGTEAVKEYLFSQYWRDVAKLQEAMKK